MQLNLNLRSRRRLATDRRLTVAQLWLAGTIETHEKGYARPKDVEIQQPDARRAAECFGRCLGQGEGEIRCMQLSVDMLHPILHVMVEEVTYLRQCSCRLRLFRTRRRRHGLHREYRSFAVAQVRDAESLALGLPRA